MFLGVMIAALTAVFCLTVASNACRTLCLGWWISTGLVFAFGRRLLLQEPLPDNGYGAAHHHLPEGIPLDAVCRCGEGHVEVASIVIGLRLEHHQESCVCRWGITPRTALGWLGCWSQYQRVIPGGCQSGRACHARPLYRREQSRAVPGRSRKVLPTLGIRNALSKAVGGE